MEKNSIEVTRSASLKRLTIKVLRDGKVVAKKTFPSYGGVYNIEPTVEVDLTYDPVDVPMWTVKAYLSEIEADLRVAVTAWHDRNEGKKVMFLPSVTFNADFIEF